MQTALAETTDQLPVAPPAGASPVMAMLSDAIQKGMSIDVIREIKAMAKEIAADEARRAFDEAIASAKSEITPIVKNRSGHGDKRYADFAAIATAVDPILSRHGLSYRHRSDQGDKIVVTCILSHKAGHFEETKLTGPADTSGSKNAIQAIGSTLTYLQRYTLLLALGLATSQDDDGQAAGAGETISDEQLAELRTLADEVGGDIAKLCQHFKVEALPDLPKAKFVEAVGIMELKRRKAAK